MKFQRGKFLTLPLAGRLGCHYREKITEDSRQLQRKVKDIGGPPIRPPYFAWFVWYIHKPYVAVAKMLQVFGEFHIDIG